MSGSRADPSRPGATRRGRGISRSSLACALTARCLAACLAALPLMTMDTACAQVVGPPIRLTPSADPSASVPVPSPVAPPVTSPVEEAAPPAAPSMAVVPVVPRPPPVASQPLGPPDPDGAGLLSGGEGLGGDPWRGVSQADALPLLAALPVNTPSPTAKALQRRLLLSAGSPALAVSAGAPPSGPAPVFGDAPSSHRSGRRFGALRVTALARLGDARAAAELADRLPGLLSGDEAAARALTDAELLFGPMECAKAQARGQGFEDPYWRKVDLYCRARLGDRAGADLALAMLRERAGRADPFLPLAESLTGGPPPGRRALLDASPVALAAMRTARVPVPPDALALTDPALLAAIATNPATDPATRASAGERAAAALFLDTRQLLDLYAQIPVRGDEILRARDLAGRDRSAYGRALLHQAMAATMDGSRRVALAALAVELVDPLWRSGPVGGAAAALLDTVSPTPDAAALAPAATRLYAAVGRLDAAKRWYDLAQRGRTADAAWLWPLAAVSGLLPRGADAAGLSPWLAEAVRGAGDDARTRVAGQLALLQAVGVAVPDSAWLAATDGAGPPGGVVGGVDPALWQRLGDAATGGRVGETVAVALLLLGEGGPTGTPPRLVARVAANLTAVGLEGDARALVREAMAALVAPTGSER
ncbi:hypothetical protein [Azospirillum griseum]|uniref:Antifreeze glycopeptide polyprotein n=1 Tax=Azospirillum griseum TaxID=2496639 RepID=A0A3S0R751_9PROT|nr:hypothetical protein [Azospirillum griseum]RTR17432.1 hypothetical protein EJ903_18225 [Azospirillum griseum]